MPIKRTSTVLLSLVVLCFAQDTKTVPQSAKPANKPPQPLQTVPQSRKPAIQAPQTPQAPRISKPHEVPTPQATRPRSAAPEERHEARENVRESREPARGAGALHIAPPVVRRPETSFVKYGGKAVDMHKVFGREVRPRNYRPTLVVTTYEKPPELISLQEQYVIVGPAPRPGLLFIPGYYLWTTDTYVWIDPIWSAPPVAGAIWIPPHWTQDGDQWAMQEGYWQEPADDQSTDAAQAAQIPLCYMAKNGAIYDPNTNNTVDPQTCAEVRQYIDGTGWVTVRP